MRRRLPAIALIATIGLVVTSELAQETAEAQQTTTTTKKKKKKKKKKTTAPAASSSASAAPIELDNNPPPAASGSTAPAAPAAPPAASEAPAEEGAPAKEGEAKASVSAGASAEGEAGGGAGSATPWSVGGLVGWGFNGGAQLGFGVRGGYTLPMALPGGGHLYVGAQFIYHLGESEFGGTANFFYPGVEAGYELPVGPLVVRPYLGTGPIVLHLSLPPATNAGVTVAQGSSSTTYFGIWPGVTATYPVTPMFFVGADARYVILSSFAHLALFATAGARF